MAKQNRLNSKRKSPAKKPKKYESSKLNAQNMKTTKHSYLRSKNAKSGMKRQDDNSKSTSDLKTRKYLERGKGVGGGKGNIKQQEKIIKVSDKAVSKLAQSKSKRTIVPPLKIDSKKELSEDESDNEEATHNAQIEEIINKSELITQNYQKQILIDKTNDNSDEDSGSDIEIDIFQKLPLSIRGVINRAIQKKRIQKNELRRDRDELKRWKNKLSHAIDDINTQVKSKAQKLKQGNLSPYKFVISNDSENNETKNTDSENNDSKLIYQKQQFKYRRSFKEDGNRR